MLWTNWLGSSKLLQALNLPNCHTGHNKSFHPSKVLFVPYIALVQPTRLNAAGSWYGTVSTASGLPPKVFSSQNGRVNFGITDHKDMETIVNREIEKKCMVQG